MTGNQIETILEIISREEMARKTAMQTSQLQRMPLRKIWCHSGVTHLVFAKARASSLYAPVSNVPPSNCILSAEFWLLRRWILGIAEDVHPVRTAMKNNAPARFPKKLTNHVFSKSKILHRRCNNATTLYMQ